MTAGRLWNDITTEQSFLCNTTLNSHPKGETLRRLRKQVVASEKSGREAQVIVRIALRTGSVTSAELVTTFRLTSEY